MILFRAAVYLLIAIAAIWESPGPYQIMLFSLILIAILAAWKEEDNLETLGIKPKNFSQFWPMLLWVLSFFAAIFVIGLWLDPSAVKNKETWMKILDGANRYILWAFFQQMIFQGFFANSFYRGLGQRIWPAAIASGLVFAAIHLPNPVLAIGTFFFGVGASYFFLKSPNIYLVVLAQAFLASAFKWLVAKQLVDNAMRIGPRFWE